MKEHPDYKYRPRRKPKSLVKKENKFGFSISPLMSSGESLGNISRSLLPPLAPPSHHTLMSHEDLKIPRFFPPFPYPLYPIQHKLGEEFNGGKLAADLALQALYGGGTFYSSHQTMSWPGLSTATCLQPNCGCPSPPKDPKRPYLPAKLDERPFPSPGKPMMEDDGFPSDRDSSREEARYRKLEEENFSSSVDRHQEDARSQDRFSSSSSSSLVDQNEKLGNTTTTTTNTSSATTKVESSFSVQNLTSSSSNLGGHRGGHVIWRPLPVLPDLNFRGNLVPPGWPSTDWWRVPPMLSPIPQATVTNLNPPPAKEDEVQFQEEQQRNGTMARSRSIHIGNVQWSSRLFERKFQSILYSNSRS